MGGLILNRLFTKSRFLPRSLLARAPVRVGLFLLPNIPFFGYYTRLFRENTALLDRYEKRLNNFRRTGNL